MSDMRAKDEVAKLANTVHRTLFTATKGRVGGKIYGMPVLVLVTKGRKSGEPRQTMLTSPVQEDDRVVLVASYGGDPKHPAWYLNLQADPDVEVVRNGQRRPMTAHTATPEEKERLWPKVVDAYKGYAQYQTKTSRDIPLVVLEPK